MDPQTPNNLDPKLKATYDRVMGTATAPVGGQPAAQAATPPAAAPAPITDPNAPAAAPAESAPQNTSPSIPQTPYTADNLSFQAAIQQTPATNQVPGLVTPRQSSSTLRVLYIIGGVVFFVVYTFVWVKIFNLPLPF